MSIERGRVTHRSAAILVTLAVACAAPAAHAAASVSSGAQAFAAKSCTVKVKIAGRSTCLLAGKSCKTKFEKTYESKGFTCKRVKGRYQLKHMSQTF